MKIKTNFLMIGLLSLFVGSALASPLLLSELDIVPFPRWPEGPKADFSVSVAYATFVGRDNASDMVSGGINLSIVDCYVVFNITNHSDIPAKLAVVDFVAAKNFTFIPSALGGFSASSGDGSHGGSGGGARVEGLWLDGEWINVTWVPETGLQGIWTPGAQLPPESYDDPEMEPMLRGNYWIEGVPLNETITNNKVNSTSIYLNGSWVDVTGRVEYIEKQHVSATNYLMGASKLFYSEAAYGRNVSSSDFAPGSVWCGDGGFNNVWEPNQSRLILVEGSSEVGALWKGVQSLKAGEITFYTGTTNYVNNAPVNGTYFNTFSSATELKQVQFEITDNGYLYNTILADDQLFVMDSFGVEVFIEPRK